MMFRRALLLPAFALALTLVAGDRGANAQTELTTIRVASTPIDVGAEVYFAQALGWFKAAGLDVQIQAIDNGAAIASAVAGGAADIGQSNVVSIATAFEKKLPFVVLAPAGMYNSAAPTTVLVTLADAPFKTAKDLNGKTIITNGIMNIAQIGGSAWLDKNGADYKSVKWIEIPTSATSAALLSHRADAAVFAEPALGRALATGQFKIFATPYDAIGKRWQIGAWFATRDWAAAHPDAVKKFVAVMQQVAKWANTHHEESLKYLSEAAKVQYPSNMRRASYGDQLDPALFQPVIDDAAKYGAIPATFPATELFAKPAGR
jgi:ABC-type nitrate/sulfonate/bicarbonate transport system substrate-binding protein